VNGAPGGIRKCLGFIFPFFGRRDDPPRSGPQADLDGQTSLASARAHLAESANGG